MEKLAELALKFAWVRPKNLSELGAQNRKKTLLIKYIKKFKNATQISVSHIE